MSDSVDNKGADDKDFAWVKERRAGNIRIVWYIVAFCAVITAFSAWSFIRFMEDRTGYERGENLVEQQPAAGDGASS